VWLRRIRELVRADLCRPTRRRTANNEQPAQNTARRHDPLGVGCWTSDVGWPFVTNSPSKNSAIRSSRSNAAHFSPSPGGEYVFSEEGSSFVPDETPFVLARSPSDESLGYFRASLRDLGSRCMLMRSDRLVAGEPSPVVAGMTWVSRTNTDSKVPSGTTDNSPRFEPWVADARTPGAPQGRKRATHLALIFLAASIAFLPAHAQLPLARLSTVFPPGGRTGTTFEVTVTGADLDEANQLRFSHSNITAQPKVAEKTGEPEADSASPTPACL